MCVFVEFRVAAILVLYISVISETVDARPAIIHEEARVVLPDPYMSASGVCLVGNDLLVLAERPHPTGPGTHPNAAWTIVHFARQPNGDWLFTEELAAIIYDPNTDIWMDEQLACDGPVAGFSAPSGFVSGVGDSFILERTPSGWVATSIGTNASDVAVHGDSVAFGKGTTTVAVF
jgi:hypothetical protein